nr:unnamed protein product [Digitaria exilis]
MGCCQAEIPGGINTYGVQFDDRFNTSGILRFSPCSYAVLMEAAAFDFKTTYVTAGEFVKSTGGTVPLVLDWVVGKETCREAVRNTTGYIANLSAADASSSSRSPEIHGRWSSTPAVAGAAAPPCCMGGSASVSGNSECVDSRNGHGYLCNCSTGYDGNPYVPGGCQDVNECEDTRYPCSVPGTCTNTPGAFICSCPDKTSGNAYNGTCEANKSQLGVRLAIGISSLYCLNCLN